MENFSESRLQAIANAKLVLKQAGFFVDDLLHVDDVKKIEDVSSDVSQDILMQAFRNVKKNIEHEIRDIVVNRKTYYICDEDGYGQRTGTYRSIKLLKSQIDIDMYGNDRYQGFYVYRSLSQVLRACQS